IPLVFPVPDLLQNIGDLQVRQILGLLVADLGRHIQPKWRAVFARKRLIVHLITKQSLRMQRGGHVERFVVIVRAAHGKKSRRGVGADHAQKIRKPRAAEAPNHIPSFDADVTRVLAEPRQSLNLRQLIVAGFLHRAPHRQSPVLKDHSWIVHVISVDGKLFERRHLCICKSRSQMAAPEQPCRGPITKLQPLFEHRLLKARDGKGSQCQDRRNFQQFPARHPRELALVYPGWDDLCWDDLCLHQLRMFGVRLRGFRMCDFGIGTRGLAGLRINRLRLANPRFGRIRFDVLWFHSPPTPNVNTMGFGRSPKVTAKIPRGVKHALWPAQLSASRCRFCWPLAGFLGILSAEFSQERPKTRMLELNKFVPKTHRLLPAMPQARNSEERKQRRMMVIALAMLLVALGFVLYRARDFCFPETEQAEEQPQPHPPARSAITTTTPPLG